MNEQLTKMAESAMFFLIMAGRMKKQPKFWLPTSGFVIQLFWVLISSWAEESSGDDGVEDMNHPEAGRLSVCYIPLSFTLRSKANQPARVLKLAAGSESTRGGSLLGCMEPDPLGHKPHVCCREEWILIVFQQLCLRMFSEFTGFLHLTVSGLCNVMYN